MSTGSRRLMGLVRRAHIPARKRTTRAGLPRRHCRSKASGRQAAASSFDREFRPARGKAAFTTPLFAPICIGAAMMQVDNARLINGCGRPGTRGGRRAPPSPRDVVLVSWDDVALRRTAARSRRRVAARARGPAPNRCRGRGTTGPRAGSRVSPPRAATPRERRRCGRRAA